MTRNTGRITCTGAVLLLLLSSLSVQAEFKASPRNCGIYCMYAAMKWNGLDCQLAQMIQPQYVSKEEGSTLADLSRLAESNGLYAKAVVNLNLGSLKACPYPVIISVRRSRSENEFNHFYVVLPTAVGNSKAYDAINNRLIPLEQLVGGYWNGYGLVVSPKPFHLGRIFFGDYAYVIIGIPGLLLIRRFFHRKSKSVPAFAPSVNRVSSSILLILFVATVLALGSEMAWRWEPQLRGGPAVQAVQERHFLSFMPRIDASEVTRGLKAGHFIIDARQALDFNAGHIETAINLNPASTTADYNRLLANAVHDRPIIVYCQSASCPYAGTVARSLWKLGYRNLLYYKAGWIDWSQRVEQQKEQSP